MGGNGPPPHSQYKETSLILVDRQDFCVLSHRTRCTLSGYRFVDYLVAQPSLLEWA